MINLKVFCTFDVYSSYVKVYGVFSFGVLLWVVVSLIQSSSFRFQLSNINLI